MCKVTFDKSAYIYAMEEHHVRTLPTGIEFNVEVKSNGVVVLTAPGFGQKENYGNGPLLSHLWRRSIHMERDVPAEISLMKQEIDGMCELLKLCYGFTTDDNSLLPEKIRKVLIKYGKWMKE